MFGWLRWRRYLADVGAIVATCAALASCGSAPASPSTQLSVHVPTGWITHTYDGIAISVPDDWVYFGPSNVIGCVGTQVVGILELGAIQGSAGCTSFGGSSTTIVDVASGAMGTTGPTVEFRLNGLSVTQVDNNGPQIIWNLTAQDLTVSGSGPDANKVLHTLRPA